VNLKIQNFQSLKDVELELKPFTVIVGPSDCGKSALVRALEACLFNTPGKRYITWGEKSCEVCLNDGKRTITYRKGPQPAYYLDGQLYSAIGRGQFEKVADLGYKELNAEQIKVKPQLSKQYDLPFLISDIFTPTSVASILGTLSDSTIATQAKKLVEGDVRAITGKINHFQDDLEVLNAELGPQQEIYADLSSIMGELDKGEAQLLIITKEFEQLTFLADKLHEIGKEIKKLREIDLAITNPLSSARLLLPGLEKDLRKSEKVLDLLEKYQNLTREIKGLDELCKVKKEFTKIEQDLTQNAELRRNWERLEERYVLVVQLAKCVEFLRNLIKTIGEYLKKLTPFLTQIPKSIKILELSTKYDSLNDETLNLVQQLKKTKFEIQTCETEMSKFKICETCGRPL